MPFFISTQPTTPKEAFQKTKHINNKFFKKALRALRGKKAVTDHDLAVFRCLAGKENPLPDLIASNLTARQKMGRLIYRSMNELAVQDPELEFGHVTIFDREWETSDQKTVIDVVGMQRATRPTLSEMAPNFLAVGEVQAFANVRHQDGGVVLSEHVHALIWGVNLRKTANAVVDARQQRYGVSFNGVLPIKLDWIRNTKVDRARVATYAWKLSDRCKTLYQNAAHNPTRANLHESEANDRFIRYLRILQIHSTMSISRGVFSGGPQAKAIRDGALRETKAWLDCRATLGIPPIHPDEVVNFWAEFMPRIGLGRFPLPLVKYR